MPWNIFKKKMAYLSQPLQNCRVACLGMLSVMSTRVRRQPTHILAGFGSMGSPHSQQGLRVREESRLYCLQELNFILQNGKCHLQNLYEISTGYVIHTSFPSFAPRQSLECTPFYVCNKKNNFIKYTPCCSYRGCLSL